jgi:OTU-like cysteine protease
MLNSLLSSRLLRHHGNKLSIIGRLSLLYYIICLAVTAAGFQTTAFRPCLSPFLNKRQRRSIHPTASIISAVTKKSITVFWTRTNNYQEESDSHAITDTVSCDKFGGGIPKTTQSADTSIITSSGARTSSSSTTSTASKESVGTPGPSSSSSITTSQKYLPFSSFQFAPNGVCVSPKYFVWSEKLSSSSVSSSSTLQTNDDAHHNNTNIDPIMMTMDHYFTMRNVPGDGDCMFLAVALATLASMGLGGNDAFLVRAVSRETRSIVATILESGNGTLIVTGNRTINTSTLLRQAASGENLSIPEYIRQLKLDGKEGGLYGGGPELTVLTNVLRRPISIYHLAHPTNNDNNLENIDIKTKSISIPIQCMGIFGAETFTDPLLVLNDNVHPSAVLSSELQSYGAYSWHLHILVVDSSPTEKHACVLFPQQIEKQQITNKQTTSNPTNNPYQQQK